VEVAAKIAGDGAKNIAAFLYAAMKNRDKSKIKGKARLTSMLKSGKELKVFAVKESDLKKFSQEAKRYGIVYCVLRDKGNADGLCDIMVRAEDASKINRIVERFNFAAVDSATIKSEITRTKAEKTAATEENNSIEPPAPNAENFAVNQDTDKLLDELLPVSDKDNQREGKAGKPETAKAEKAQKKEQTRQNPLRATAEQSRPSAPISKTAKTSEKVIYPKPQESVKEFLTEATERRKQEDKAPKRDERQTDNRRNTDRQKYNRHRQPNNYRRKTRTPKIKEERE
jgi:hypothetical protein